MENSFRSVKNGKKVQENWPFNKKKRIVIIIVTTKKNSAIFSRFQGQQKTWLSKVDREKDLVLVTTSI